MRTSREAFLQTVRQAVQRATAPALLRCLPSGAASATRGPVPIRSRALRELTDGRRPSPSRRTTDAAILPTVLATRARQNAAPRPGRTRAVTRRARICRSTLRRAGVEDRRRETLGQRPAATPSSPPTSASRGVDYLIAETGSVVLGCRPDEPRSLSLLPPVHIAVADRSQLLPDLFDLFAAARRRARQPLPSCLSLITGPSKTGDIELQPGHRRPRAGRGSRRL